jgi:hypothetical protein
MIFISRSSWFLLPSKSKTQDFILEV